MRRRGLDEKNAPMYTQHTLNVHLEKGNVHLGRGGKGWIKTIWLFLLLWGAFGCSPTDPVSGMAYYQGQLDATTQAERQRMARKTEEASVWTEAARRTAEIGTRQVEATRNVLEVRATELNGTQMALRLERERLNGEQTAVVATQAYALYSNSYHATGTAIMERAAQEPARQAWATFANVMWKLCGLAAGAAALGLAGLYIWAKIWGRYKREQRWLELAQPAGMVIEGQEADERDEAALREDALILIEMAMRVNGRSSTEIPRWQTIGWSSDHWQRVTGWLASKRALNIRGGVGTRVTQPYKDVTGLWIALKRGEVENPPTPLWKDAKK